MEASASESDSSNFDSDNDRPPLLTVQSDEPSASDIHLEDGPDVLEAQKLCHVCNHEKRPSDKKDFVNASGFKKGENKAEHWICCDFCSRWYHFECVGLEEFEIRLFDHYFCQDCSKTQGPTTLKKVICPHRRDFANENEKDLPMEIGTKSWVDVFKTWESNIPNCNDLKVVPTGVEFMKTFSFDKEWVTPLKVLQPEGLGMKLPHENFTMEDLMTIVPEDEIIETIDVYVQCSWKMSMKKFYEKWNEHPRQRLYNMLSFEFSDNEKLMDMIRAPQIMYDLSWVHQMWPENLDDVQHDCIIADEHLDQKPSVSMFCLLGMGGSFTDFHIDFGGSSVWYHVFKGQKVFYVIPPTEKTLKVFLDWSLGDHKFDVFLGDLVKDETGNSLVRRVVVNEGETLMIPSGWIHAVYTPVDSMVFGGNFIHDLNIKRQLEVYEIELKCKYDETFLFPSFELVNWYAALRFLERIQTDVVPSEIIEGYRALYFKLQEWFAKDKASGIGVFKDVITRMKRELFDAEDEEEDYDPAIESKKKQQSLPLKIKLPLHPKNNNVVESEKKPRKMEKKLTTLPKKDGKYVSKMFAGVTSSGRTPVTAPWVKSSLGFEESQPGPSHAGNKNFMQNLDEETRKRAINLDQMETVLAKKRGEDDYTSDSEDESTPKKKKKKSSTPRSSRIACPKPAPKGEATVKQRLWKKMQRNKR